MMKKLVLFFFSALFLGCQLFLVKYNIYYVKNNSKDTLTYYASYNYPDTLILTSKPSLKNISPNEVMTESSKEKFETKNPSGVISIYFFKKSVVDKNSWDIIIRDKLILKRVDVVYKDLASKQWTISFP